MPYKERMDKRREAYLKERKEILEELKKEFTEMEKEKEEIDILKKLYEEAKTVKEAQRIKKEILEKTIYWGLKIYFDEDCNPLIKASKEKRRETQYRKEKERREKQEEEKRRIEEAKTKEEKEHDRRIQEINDKYTPQIKEVDDEYPPFSIHSESFTKHYTNIVEGNRLKRPIRKRWDEEIRKELLRWKKEKLQLGLKNYQLNV